MAEYQYFDHTADVGMRVVADSLETLFQKGAEGLTNLIVPAPESVQVVDWREIRLENDDPAYLFFDWLSELTYLFETDGFVGGRFEVTMPDERHLEARVGGETFDPDRHPSGNEVKAVTYHGLVVEPTAEGWQAEVIFDI